MLPTDDLLPAIADRKRSAASTDLINPTAPSDKLCNSEQLGASADRSTDAVWGVQTHPKTPARDTVGNLLDP